MTGTDFAGMSFVSRVRTFLFPTQSTAWMTLLRLGLGLVLFLYVLSLRNDWLVLVGDKADGLIGRGLGEALLSLQTPLVPRLDWLVQAGTTLGLAEDHLLGAAWWLLLLAALGLCAGLYLRVTAVAAWLLHLATAKSLGFLAYGLDSFLTIGLFYLALAPWPDRYSLDYIWRRRPLRDAAVSGFFQRLLQVHLCLIYFFSGLSKCLGADWWNGLNLWRALTRPPFNQVPPEMLVPLADLLPVLGVGICLVELGYIVLIWPARTRRLWLCLVLAMHAMIAFGMGMYLFGLVMVVLNLAAFGPGTLLRPARRTGSAGKLPSRSA